MKHLEKENMQQSKDNLSLRNKLKQTETEIEAKVDKLLSLEKQLEEMHEAFELMSEIVFATFSKSTFSGICFLFRNRLT